MMTHIYSSRIKHILINLSQKETMNKSKYEKKTVIGTKTKIYILLAKGFIIRMVS